mgnify:CR=1 FL=1
MAKKTFERTKTHGTIGTMGHIDDGKTALTGPTTKRQPETGLADAVSVRPTGAGPVPW